MLIKDKDILAEKTEEKTKDEKEELKALKKIKKENMRSAWGDAFDYYLRGITERYLLFRGRASRIEFWGFWAVSGLITILLYFFGEFVDIKMLAYYYTAATIIPMTAVSARRLHDVNKSAALYLGVFAVLIGLSIFVNPYIAVAVLFWFILLVYFFSLEADINEGIYGAANDEDCSYGVDTARIAAKFRLIALATLVIELVGTSVLFDNWSRQATQRATIDLIMEQVTQQGRQAGLTEEQTAAAQKLMQNTLKKWQGQRVSEEELLKEIGKAVQSIGNQ